MSLAATSDRNTMGFSRTKKVVAGAATMLLAFTGLFATGAAPAFAATYGVIEDTSLAACVNTTLADNMGTERALDQAITATEMETLTSFSCYHDMWGSAPKVTDLEGLQFATNLTNLNLGYNDVTNLTPIANLPLTVLALDNNENLSDFTPLVAMTSLVELDIRRTSILNLASLTNNTGLLTLDVSGTAFNDLTGISSFSNLQSINIQGTRVTDLAPISGMGSLTYLQLGWGGWGDNLITDFTPVSTLPALNSFINWGYETDNLNFLANKPSLVRVSVNMSNTTDYSALATLVNLETLQITNNQLTDSELVAVQNLTNLTSLSISSNLLTDITPVQNLTQLTSISGDFNQIADISPLANLTSLTAISMGNNNISDVSALSGLTQLTYVTIANNHVSDLSPFADNIPVEATNQTITLPSLTVPHTVATFTTPAVPAYNVDGTVADIVGPHVVSHDKATNLITWDAVALRGQTSTSYTFTAGEFGDNLSGTVAYSALDIKDASLDVISDPVLAACINANIAATTATTRSATQPITVAEMANVTNLVCNAVDSANPATQVASLSGMEHATNLTSFTANGNNITDLTPLAGITSLTNLELRNNVNLVSLAPLTANTTLTRVILENTAVADLAPLSNNTALVSLLINGTNVTDLTPLTGFTSLESLLAEDTQLVSLAPIATLTGLTGLTLSNLVDVTDFTPISNLDNLVNLMLNNSNVTDLEFLEGLGLSYLTADNNQIEDVTVLGTLPNLSNVELNGNNIADLSSIADTGVNVYAENQTIDGGVLTVPHTVATFDTVAGIRNVDGGGVTTVNGSEVTSYTPSTNTLTWDAAALRALPTASYTFEGNTSSFPNMPFSGTVTYTVNAIAAPVNVITDPNLAACINATLGGGRAANAVITSTDLLALTSLVCVDTTDAPASKVTSLAGLQYATNLVSVNFLNQDITDLAPLAGLPLTTVNLSENPNLSNIAPLNAATVVSLYLADTAVSDVSPLTSFASLETLNVTNSPVASLAFVSGTPNLSSLSLQGTSVTDLTPLIAIASGFTTLAIGDSGISDFTPISSLTDLTNLTIFGSNLVGVTFVSDTAFLADLTNLTYLNLRNNRITDVSTIAALPNLSYVDIAFNRVGDMSPFDDGVTLFALDNIVNGGTLTVPHTVETFSTPSLFVAQDGSSVPLISNDAAISIDPATNAITWDANYLRTQTYAEYFVSSSTVSGVVTFDTINVVAAPVNVVPDANLADCINSHLNRTAGTVIVAADLVGITELSCGAPTSDPAEQITNLEGLQFATDLEILNVGGNNITDLTPLADLTNLEILGMSGNENLADLTGITGSTSIIEAWLADTAVANIAPLVGNTGLELLHLDNTAITSLAGVENFTSLINLSAMDIPLTSLAPVQGITTLESLGLNGAMVTDYSPVSSLSSLMFLAIDGSNVGSIDFLAGLENLEFVSLNGNDITDVTVLGTLDALTVAYLDGNAIADLSAIADTVTVAANNQNINGGTLTVPHTVATFTTNGTVKTVTNNGVTPTGANIVSYDAATDVITWDAVALRSAASTSYTFSSTDFTGTVTYPTIVVQAVPVTTVPDAVLADCINLALGNPSGSPITVADMESLTELVCVDSDITDLTGLEDAINLEEIDLSGNDNLSDLTPLEDLPLTNVDVSDTNVTDLSPIENIASLTDLDVSNTGLISTAGIETIASLERLIANNNFLTTIAGLATMPNLERVTVNANSISNLSTFDGTSITVIAGNQTLSGSRVMTSATSTTTYKTPVAVVAVDGSTPAYTGSPAVDYDATENLVSWASADLVGLTTVAYNFDSGNGFSGTVTYAVEATSITTPSTVTLPVGDPAVVPITTDGTFVPVEYDVDGTLPEGIVFNPVTGELTGTPTENNETVVTVIAIDADGNTVEQDVTIITGTGISASLAAPSAPEVTVDAENSVAVEWDAVIPAVADGTIASYTVEYTNVGTGVTETITGITGTTYNTPVLPAGTYEFVVSYVTTTGSSSLDSAATSVVIVTVVPPVVVPPVTNPPVVVPPVTDSPVVPGNGSDSGNNSDTGANTDTTDNGILPFTGAQLSIAAILVALLTLTGGTLMVVRKRKEETIEAE